MPKPRQTVRGIEPRRQGSSQPAGRDQTAAIIIGVVVGGGLLVGGCVMVALLLPAVGAARGAARTVQCKNNLKSIGIADANYLSLHKGFAPPVGPSQMPTPNKGPELASWRVELLAFLDQKSLFDQYDFNQPFDGGGNASLIRMRPPTYVCPDDVTLAPTEASYVKPVGPGTPWKADGTYEGRFDPGAITDGVSNTIAVVERAHDTPVWSSPVDTGSSFKMEIHSIPETGDPLASSHHVREGGGVNVLLYDGAVTFLSAGIDRDIVAGLLTPDGGEPTVGF